MSTTDQNLNNKGVIMNMSSYSSPGMKTFIQKRAIAASEHQKATGNSNPSNTFSMKMDKPSMPENASSHIEAAHDHMNAASSVKMHDHEAAADHLQKAAIHTQAAAQEFEKHSKHWIQKAIKHPGAFTKKAKAAHKSVVGEAHSVLKKGSKASSHTKHQAALALTLGHMAHKK